MKRNMLPMLALALAGVPLGVRAEDAHQTMVMSHGAAIMPFDQEQAMHMFLPSAMGGVIEIVVHDMDAAQIARVRSHLLQEAAKFARADFSGPRLYSRKGHAGHGAAREGVFPHVRWLR